MKTKSKMGRPRKAKGTAMDVLIGAKFVPNEANQVLKAIAKSGQMKSDWIRKTLLQAAKSASV